MKATKLLSVILSGGLLLSTSSFAMNTPDFDRGMEKGIDYFNRGMYYEARDEFQWFADYNWGDLNEGQQKYLLDYLGGTKAIIQNIENKYSVYNGNYAGGGVQIPGSIYKIGEWHATIANTTANSMTLSFSQGESDYYVSNITLYRQENGSYYGFGYSDWGKSYITVWLETPQRISLTVSGAADQIGTNLLYK